MSPRPHAPAEATLDELKKWRTFNEIEIDMKSVLRNSQSGFQIIDLMLSMVLAFIITFALIDNLTNSRATLGLMTNQDSCHMLANNLLAAVTSYDNALTVRNFLPRAGNNSVVNADNADPLCSGNDQKDPICDSLNFFDSTFGLADPPYFNSQNIRGAATWAQSLYNARIPDICAANGIVLAPAALTRLLPKTVNTDGRFDNISLSIIENSGVACGARSTLNSKTGGGYRVRFTVNGRDPNTNVPISCSSSGLVTFPADSVKPTLNVKVTNGNGEVVGPNQCTCKKSVLDSNVLGCAESQVVNIQYTSNEPGVLLLCGKDSPLIDARIDARNFQSCGDLNFAGALPNAITPAVPNFNQPANFVITLNRLPINPLEPFRITAKAVDVGGNESNLMTTNFNVKTPSCPPPTSYCPPDTPGQTTMAPGVPGWSGDIHQTPNDDCGNGICPAGQKNCSENCGVRDIWGYGAKCWPDAHISNASVRYISIEDDPENGAVICGAEGYPSIIPDLSNFVLTEAYSTGVSVRSWYLKTWVSFNGIVSDQIQNGANFYGRKDYPLDSIVGASIQGGVYNVESWRGSKNAECQFDHKLNCPDDGVAEVDLTSYAGGEFWVCGYPKTCGTSTASTSIRCHSVAAAPPPSPSPSPSPTPTPPPTPIPTPTPATKDTLIAGQFLTADVSNNTLVSSDGRFTLIYQDDGNLVIYQKDVISAVWHTNTWGTSPGKAIMQADGNFVVYDSSDIAKWNSETFGHSDTHVIMQSDGNLVVYDSGGKALWSRVTGRLF